jgi:hypothetical protein
VLAEISMDFIEGLSLSHENSVLLVVVDGLSKYAQFMPISHPFIAAKMPREMDKFFFVGVFQSTGHMFSNDFSLPPSIGWSNEILNKCLEHYLRCYA